MAFFWAYLLAVASAIANGTFSAAQKLNRVQKSNVDPLIFNYYVVLGIFLSSWVAVAFFPLVDGGVELQFDMFGVLAGFILVIATALTFIAIPLVGLVLSHGLLAASAITTSFLWGWLGPAPLGSPTTSLPISIVAVVLLVIAVVAIVYAEEIPDAVLNLLRRCGARTHLDQSAAQLVNDGAPRAAGDLERGEPEHGSNPNPKDIDAVASPPRSPTTCESFHLEPKASDCSMPTNPNPSSGASGITYIFGIVVSLLIGVFGGSVLVPAKFSEGGFNFVPWLGTGCLIAGTIFTGVYIIWRRTVSKVEIVYAPQSALVPGVLAGCLWNAGNIMQIFAMYYGDLSYAIAYPILQCSLLVTGIIGIAVYKELTRGLSIFTFFFASAILIVGAVLLALYGPMG